MNWNWLRRLFLLPLKSPTLRRTSPPATTAADAAPSRKLRDGLYPLAVFITAILLVVQSREFLLGDSLRQPPYVPEMYLALLAAFAGDQEARKWNLQDDRYAIHAELLIYLWWLFFAVVLMAVTFTDSYHVPHELTRICVEMLAVLFGTKASQIFRDKKGTAESRPQVHRPAAKQQILDYLADHPEITAAACATLLGLSDRQARTILSKLATEGVLEKVSTSSRAPIYKLSTP